MSVLWSVFPQVNSRLWIAPFEDEETSLLKAEEQVFQFKQSIRMIKAPKPVGIVDQEEEEEHREPPDLQQEPDEESNPQDDEEEEEQVTEERSQSLEVEEEDNEQIVEAIFDDETLARQMHLHEQFFGEEDSTDIPEQQFIEEDQDMVMDED